MMNEVEITTGNSRAVQNAGCVELEVAAEEKQRQDR
jgi:hypothetical protein